MSCASASVDRPPAPVPSTIASNSLTLSAPAPCCLSRSRGRSVRGSSLILNVLLVGGPGCSYMHDLRTVGRGRARCAGPRVGPAPEHGKADPTIADPYLSAGGDNPSGQ